MHSFLMRREKLIPDNDEGPAGKRANDQSLSNPTPDQVAKQRKWARWYERARAKYVQKHNQRKQDHD
jgi:hypothetical protein